MEFEQVIQTCLDFSIANGGTIQSYPANQPDRLALHSRTSRTEILVARDLGNLWQAEQLQDAMGEKNKMSVKEMGIDTEENLLKFIQRVWNQ